MKYKLASLTMAVVLAATATAPAFAQNLAIVNGTAIPKADADFMAKAMEQERNIAPNSKGADEIDKMVRDQLITQELLRQAAQKEGLSSDADVKAQLSLSQSAILARTFVKNFFEKEPVSDAELNTSYEKFKAAQGTKEYEVRHILVTREDTAKQIIAKLAAGQKFADLAKKYSEDVGSATSGGDLGWASLSSYVPEFSDAVQKLQKGKYTKKPVQSKFGWHVIELDGVRPKQIPTLAEVKPKLTQSIREEKLKDLIQNMKDKAKIQ